MTYEFCVNCVCRRGDSLASSLVFDYTRSTDLFRDIPYQTQKAVLVTRPFANQLHERNSRNGY
jgi:hypothetical protein